MSKEIPTFESLRRSDTYRACITMPVMTRMLKPRTSNVSCHLRVAKHEPAQAVVDSGLANQDPAQFPFARGRAALRLPRPQRPLRRGWEDPFHALGRGAGA